MPPRKFYRKDLFKELRDEQADDYVVIPVPGYSNYMGAATPRGEESLMVMTFWRAPSTASYMVDGKFEYFLDDAEIKKAQSYIRNAEDIKNESLDYLEEDEDEYTRKVNDLEEQLIHAKMELSEIRERLIKLEDQEVPSKKDAHILDDAATPLALE